MYASASCVSSTSSDVLPSMPLTSVSNHERKRVKSSQIKNVNRGRWTKEEDKRLKDLVLMHGEDWPLISQHFKDRTDSQCQQRWEKVVNPSLVKGPWTKEVCILFSASLFSIYTTFLRRAKQLSSFGVI